jgi:hypothetical protein
MIGPIRLTASGAFGQTQEIVDLRRVGLGLDVFASTDGRDHEHVSFVVADPDEEILVIRAPRLDPSDYVLDRQFPLGLPVPANVRDVLDGTLSVWFVYAAYLISSGHLALHV